MSWALVSVSRAVVAMSDAVAVARLVIAVMVSSSKTSLEVTALAVP